MRYLAVSSALPDISCLSLGSWNTFSRLSVDENARLLRRAIDLGINLFDVGYYWDKPDTEEIFGSAVRAAGLTRDQYILAEKLWLWDYPAKSFADQLKSSLGRLGCDYVDVIMVSRPLPALDFMAICEEVVELIDLGLARAWGVTNWEPDKVRAIVEAFRRRGRPLPCMVQMQYNAARREIVEGQEFETLFSETGIRLCAAHTLEGGILAGHLDRDRVDPSQMRQGMRPLDRNIARDSGHVREKIRAAQPKLAEIAHSFGLSAAQAAIAFTQAHPALATGLFGVTRIQDLEENVAALRFGDLQTLRKALEPIMVVGAAHPKLFSPTDENP